MDLRLVQIVPLAASEARGSVDTRARGRACHPEWSRSPTLGIALVTPSKLGPIIYLRAEDGACSVEIFPRRFPRLVEIAETVASSSLKRGIPGGDGRKPAAGVAWSKKIQFQLCS